MRTGEPFCFQRATSWLDNLSTIPNGTASGVTVTAGASNAMGSVETVLGPVAHDTHLLCLAFSGWQASGSAIHVLADLFLDPAGGTSWAVTLAESLMVGFSAAVTTGGGGAPVYVTFPIWAPAGATFGVSAQVSTTTTYAGKVHAWSFGDPSRPGAWWCGRRVETIGVSRSTSKGQAFTPGASSAWSSWTNVGSSTTRRWRSLQWTLGGTDSAAVTGSMAFEIGVSGTRLLSIPRCYATTSNTEQQMRLTPPTPLFCDIPSGTQLQVRGAFSTTGPEENNIAIHGVY